MALAEAGCDLVVNGRDAEAAGDDRRRMRDRFGVEGDRDRRRRVEARSPEGSCLPPAPIPTSWSTTMAGRRFAISASSTAQKILEGVTQNMVTPIELVQAVIDGMAERGFGRIVNITSLSVYVPIPGLDVSSGARAGLTSFLAGVARTVADRNVTINNLLPGKLDTDRLRGACTKPACRRSGGSHRAQGSHQRRHSRQAARHAGGVRPDLRLPLFGPCRLSDRAEHSGGRRPLYQRVLTDPVVPAGLFKR